MRRQTSINIIMHFPKSEEGKVELSRHVADVHANAVTMQIKKLNCPNDQKQQLLEAVIRDANATCEQKNKPQSVFHPRDFLQKLG